MTDFSSSHKEETSDSESELDAQREPVDMNDEDTDPHFEETPANNQEKMRRRLQFFFMNPIEKWQAKRR